MDVNFAPQIDKVFHAHKKFFLSGVTRSVDFRIEQLQNLKSAILEYRDEICAAMRIDLGRTIDGVDMGEINPVIAEIDFAINNLADWNLDERVPSASVHANSECYVTREAFGVTYIIVPFNYPIYLFAGPLIGAIVGGNTAFIKPSEATPHTSRVIESIVLRAFDMSYVHVIQGGKEENEYLLTKEFDLIFFTGSPAVGKIVMKAAARNLTPVLLELGGKCPLIVLADADIEKVAQDLMFAKTFNSGQTCVAPDYVLVDSSIKERLIFELKRKVETHYKEANSHGKIISDRQYASLELMLERTKGSIIYQGRSDYLERQLGVALVDNVKFDDSLMEEELFAPIIPVISFNEIEEVAANINRHHPKPLAAYVYTSNFELGRNILDQIPAGDCGVNAMMLHAFSPNLPFGGVGSSGFGSYHGKYSYDAFTHLKSVVINKLQAHG